MRVIEADNCGACYGVQRALEIADSTLNSGVRACTLGSLIHNPEAVAKLAEKGLNPVASVEDIDTPSVVIRSHGITPGIRREIEAKGVGIIDATCPHVIRAQKAAASLASQVGYVIVVGDAGHPEVNSLEAFAHENGAEVVVCKNPDELPCDLPQRVGVVVQTTQTRAVLSDIISALERKGVGILLKETICQATSLRQNAAVDLAKQVDMVIVLGGKDSANTAHLADVCREACERTYHVESFDDLDEIDFSGVESIGLTAGASTPRNQITRLRDYLRAF